MQATLATIEKDDTCQRRNLGLDSDHHPVNFMTTNQSLERFTPQAAPVPAWQPIPAPVTIDLEAQESATPLSHYRWVLRRRRWKIRFLSCWPA